MMDMKVLVVGISGIYGGVEKIVMGIVSRCVNVEFDFLCYGNETENRKKMLMGRTVYYISNRKDGLRKSNSELKNFFKIHCNDYKVVWINTGSASNITIHKYAKKYSHAKIITHSHSSQIEHNNKVLQLIHTVRHVINRGKIVKLSDCCIACSDKAAQHLYGNTKDVVILNNAIETHKYYFNYDKRIKIRKKYNISNDEHLLIMIGRIEYVKNPNFALKVLQSLLLEDSDYKLMFVGIGSMKDTLINYAKEEKMEDKLIFAGFQTDIEQYLSAADCLLLPSFFEGFPVVLVEAQSNSLPCVVSNTITQEAKLTTFVSYLGIKDENIEEWCSLIERKVLIERKHMVCFENIEKYDLEYSSNMFMSILENVIDEK